MKYYFMLLLAFGFTFQSFCQKKPEKVEQYCIVNCHFGRKSLTANFDFGNETKL